MATRQSTQQAMRERGADATRQLREALELQADRGDLKLLGTALAEVAVEEGRRNPRFTAALRDRYNELSALYTPSAKRPQRQRRDTLTPLIPIRRFEYDATRSHAIDPWAPPNPRDLVELYGNHQLARALVDYSLNSLKQATAILEAEHPGTKPTNRGRKDALITYIVEFWDKPTGA